MLSIRPPRVPLAAAVAALMMASAAVAQQVPNVCAAQGVAGPSAVVPDANMAPLPCLPAWAGGTGAGDGYRVTTAGVTPWLWCPTRAIGTLRFGWVERWGAYTHQEIAERAAAVPGVLMAPDRMAAAAAALARFDMPALGAPERLAIWCPHWPAIMASRPPEPAFRVVRAPAGTVPAGTRSVFDYVPATATSPARFLATAARVTQGSACSCVRTLWTSATQTYCYVPAPGVASPVALCELVR